MTLTIENVKNMFGKTATKRDPIRSTIVHLLVFAMVGTFASGVDVGLRGKIDSTSRSIRRLTECLITVEMACHGCELGSVEANDYSCDQPPTLLGMLFRGGTCEENVFETQLTEPLSCIDYNDGPPKQGSNEAVYIRVLDETNKEVLFEGTVHEGSVYNISNSNDSIPMGSKLEIVIFTDSTLQTPLQSATFEVTCGSSADETLMFSVFGSSQIVTIANDAQETISADTPDLTIDIELSNTGTSAITVQELYVRNSLGITGVTGRHVLGPSNKVQVSFELPFPASGESSVDNIVTGVGVMENGESCRFASFESFPILV
jgi:hypothetical protein